MVTSAVAEDRGISVNSADFYLQTPAQFSDEVLAEMYKGWRAIAYSAVFKREQQERDRVAEQMQFMRLSNMGMGLFFPFSRGLMPPPADEAPSAEQDEIRRMDSSHSLATVEEPQYDIRGPTFGLDIFGPQFVFTLDNEFKGDIIESSPELVLFKYPFLLSADTKRRFVQIDDQDQHRFYATTSMLKLNNPFFILEISRENILRDVFAELQTYVQTLENSGMIRKPLKVKFKNEDGLDAGGVRKEFFLLLSAELFNPDYGHFKEIGKTHQLWFSNNLDPSSLGKGDTITYEMFQKLTDTFDKGEMMNYKLIGMIIGLAMYNDTLLDVQFPSAMYQILLNQLRGDKLTLKDFKKFDPDRAKILETLQQAQNSDEVELMSLSFEITEAVYDEYKNIELCPGGSKRDVTLNNRDEFIFLYIKHHMYSSLIEKKATKLMEGFNIVIKTTQAALKLFRPDELELLVCGTPELDMQILVEKCEYEGGYNAHHKTIKRFWKIIESFDDDQKKLLLKFCTGSSRAPVGGLKNIKFKIQRAGPDANKLPTAYTCFNTLLLPDYSSEEKMRKYLLLAIENSEGFGLE